MQVKRGFNPLNECVEIPTLEYFTDKRPSGQESVLCGSERRLAKIKGSGRVNRSVAGC
jgi:hypothetical protein